MEGGAVEGGCESPALPGVWHWLEPMMNVTYGNPRNWPTPGSLSILRWKFPFSKAISSSGKAVEQPVRQHRRRGSPSFSSWRIQRRSERRGWIHALAAVNSAKPRNVNLSGSLKQWWGLNLVKSCTHVWFLFRFGRVYFGLPHFPVAETALKSRTISLSAQADEGRWYVWMSERGKMTPAIIFPFLITHSTSPCSPTSTWWRQGSFVRGVHLEQLCHTCFHVLLDYRAAGSGFKAPPSLSLCLCAMHSGN